MPDNPFTERADMAIANDQDLRLAFERAMILGLQHMASAKHKDANGAFRTPPSTARNDGIMRQRCANWIKGRVERLFIPRYPGQADLLQPRTYVPYKAITLAWEELVYKERLITGLVEYEFADPWPDPVPTGELKPDKYLGMNRLTQVVLVYGAGGNPRDKSTWLRQGPQDGDWFKFLVDLLCVDQLDRRSLLLGEMSRAVLGSIEVQALQTYFKEGDYARQ